MEAPITLENLLKYMSATFVPPGAGVHTVHTAQDKRLKVQQTLYASSVTEFKDEWMASVRKFFTDDSLGIYAICSDSGGGIQRGANWGPLAIREYLYTTEWATAFSKSITDLGDVRVNPQLLMDEYLNEKTIGACRAAMYGDEKMDYPVSPLSIAEKFLESEHKLYPKKKLILLGGDHSVAYPAVKEFIRAKRTQGKKPAVLHFDAHTDLLDQRLGIDVCFGSWVSHIIPELASPEHLIQIGIRASGKTKDYWKATKKITQYWSDEVSARGMQAVCDEISEKLKTEGIDSIYITFDIDALDAEEAGATGTPERNGLSTQECVEFIQCVGSRFSLDGADLMEVAPFVSYGPTYSPEPITTLKNASKIIHAFVTAMKN
jgi:agmatinase